MLVRLDPVAEKGLDFREGEYETVRVEQQATTWEILASLDVATQSWNEIKEYNEGMWS
jgi:hypothetical protein